MIKDLLIIVCKRNALVILLDPLTLKAIFRRLKKIFFLSYNESNLLNIFTRKFADNKFPNYKMINSFKRLFNKRTNNR